MKLKSKFILAPMVDVSDAAFRELCSEYGAGLTFVEMLSSTAIARGNKATMRLFDVQKTEKPIGAQLMGNNKEDLVKAVKLLDKKVDVIDLNMGCPVSKVVGVGAGVALMKKPKKVKEIVGAMVKATKKPITVKIRVGWDKKSSNYLEIGKICEEAGAKMITIHAKTKSQGKGDKANWDTIKKLKDSVKIPVIGNGEVHTPEDAIRMMNETNCDYVMLARGAAKNPYIFKQIDDYITKGKYKKEDPMKDFKKYLTKAEKYNPNFKFVKNHAMYISRGAKGGARFREKLSKCKSISEIRKII